MLKHHRTARKLLIFTLTMSFLFPLLAACSSGDKQQEAEQVLRIGIPTSYGDDSHFRREFTDMFELAHKNVKIEIVPGAVKEGYRYMDWSQPQKGEDEFKNMKKLMNSSQPVDVVVTDIQTHSQLAKEGLIKDLEPLMKKDNVDTNDMIPAIMNGIKAMGDGKVYGLTSTFSSSALFYNKKLFKDAGVPLPTDGMSWDEVFALAKRVSKGEGKDRTYGFNFDKYPSSLYYQLYHYTAPLNMREYDDKAEKMVVNGPQWKKFLEQLSSLSKEKVMYQEDDSQQERREGPLAYDLFLSNKTAMVIGHYGYTDELNTVMNMGNKVKGLTPFEWDVVTLPEHHEAPGVSGGYYLSDMTAINNKATNPDLAWEFVKFVNSPEMIKLKSRSSYQLVNSQSVLKQKEGLNFNAEAFYKLKLNVPDASAIKQQELQRERPSLRYMSDLQARIIGEIISGKKSVADGLKEWETRGNDMLQHIKKNPSGKMDNLIQKEVYGK
ncbi:ABC transporter substrate-binding protein [Paenibacillus sp. 481]|uniref:ABC transporter substrate-binding protein n=1 Tax=Paenibacillus sp. 481 TaxID=2835869 RepID=UPI001E2C2322|nr:extracellular solute-binding protein [Paenibacillus sp. 481]UHA73572.1 extracellular solute-binding protein [Paenibacillus sp. 481]